MESALLDKVYSLINGIIHPNEIPSIDSKTLKVQQNKTCPVTDLDISMQPKNSKFLSSTGVQWYFDHQYKTYKDVLLPHLSLHWKDRSIEEQFREIAHNIRNQDSNPRNNTKRKVHRILADKNSLFDPIQLIDKKKLEEAGLRGLVK